MVELPGSQPGRALTARAARFRVCRSVPAEGRGDELADLVDRAIGFPSRAEVLRHAGHLGRRSIADDRVDHAVGLPDQGAARGELVGPCWLAAQPGVATA